MAGDLERDMIRAIIASYHTTRLSSVSAEAHVQSKPAFRKAMDAVLRAAAPAPEPVKAEGELGSLDQIKRAIADGFSNGNEQYDDAPQAQRDRYDMAASAVLALPEPAGEPVAWTHPVQLSMLERSPRQAAAMWGEPNGQINTPLFAHPAPVKADTAAEGWVLVPREPTPDMLDADLGVVTQGSPVAGFVGKRIFESRTDLRPMIYRAMIAAAPPPTEGGEQNSSSRSQPCADAGPCPRSSFDIQGDLDLLGGLVLHLEDGRPLTIGDPLSLAGALRRVLSTAYPNRSDAVVEIRSQLFALCEDMSDEAFTNLGRVDLVDHQAGYYRGMKYAAKATARAMGEVFRDMLRDGGEAVHTGQLREEPKDDGDPTEGGV